MFVLVAALGCGAWFVPWSSDATAGAVPGDRELFTVQRADLRITITESGRMVAKDSQRVTAKIQGEGKITFVIEEGKEVKEGDVVCRLDPTEAQSQLEETLLEIIQTEQNLKTARTELEIQVVENVASIGKSKVALERAQQELEKYRDGEAPQERRKLEIAIKNAETEWNRAKKNLEDSQKLLEQNYIKKSELEDNQIAFERRVVEKDGAELALRIFDKYTSPMAMTDLRVKLADAERDVATSQKRAESTLGQKDVAVQQVEKRLKMQMEQKKVRLLEVEHMTMKAPGPGLVLYGDPREGYYRERIKIGGQVWNGYTVMSIPDLRVMQVKLQVHEADISKLKLGLPVTVTTDSYPGLLVHGEVTKIATIGSDSSDWGGSSEVRKFATEVTLKTTPEQQLKPGISAKAEIHAATCVQALFVPLQCVFTDNGDHFCHAMSADDKAAAGQGPERRKVEIGAANETYIEIRTGLVEGDRVLLYNPSLPTSGRPAAKDQPPATPVKATPEAAEAGHSRKSGS